MSRRVPLSAAAPGSRGAGGGSPAGPEFQQQNSYNGAATRQTKKASLALSFLDTIYSVSMHLRSCARTRVRL